MAQGLQRGVAERQETRDRDSKGGRDEDMKRESQPDRDKESNGDRWRDADRDTEKVGGT